MTELSLTMIVYRYIIITDTYIMNSLHHDSCWHKTMTVAQKVKLHFRFAVPFMTGIYSDKTDRDIPLFQLWLAVGVQMRFVHHDKQQKSIEALKLETWYVAKPLDHQHAHQIAFLNSPHTHWHVWF